MKVEARVIALRLAHGDLYAVAMLLRLDVDRRHVVMVAPAFFDDHQHIGFVPGTDFDGAVERCQRDIGLRGHREVLLVALDVPVQVGANDVDAAGGGEQRGERGWQRQAFERADA